MHAISAPEWPSTARLTEPTLQATAGVLIRAYGSGAIDEARTRLTDALQDRDIEAAAAWRRLIAILAED